MLSQILQNVRNQIAGVLTVIEVVVLVRWLALALAVAQGAIGFLFGGILVEELVRFRLLRGRFPQGRELALVIVGVAIETVGWIAALLAIPLAPPEARFGPAFGVLFVVLSVEHAVIDLATSGQFRLREVIGFSAIEAVGGAVWLVNPSIGTIVVLAVTSAVEHRLGIDLSCR